uniref:Uncharacterized protein n=1 Tax=uncultured marine virus TaxID=186617 RepID=A0A0F7L6H1_9VIRU|nr:hypothetical protein [uncultured marine virus]
MPRRSALRSSKRPSRCVCWTSCTPRTYSKSCKTSSGNAPTAWALWTCRGTSSPATSTGTRPIGRRPW